MTLDANTKSNLSNQLRKHLSDQLSKGVKLSDSFIDELINNISTIQKILGLAKFFKIGMELEQIQKNFQTLNVPNKIQKKFVREYLVANLEIHTKLKSLIDQEIEQLNCYMKQRTKIIENAKQLENYFLKITQNYSGINLDQSLIEALLEAQRLYKLIPPRFAPKESNLIGLAILNMLRNVKYSQSFYQVTQHLNSLNEIRDLPGFAQLLYKIVSNLDLESLNESQNQFVSASDPQSKEIRNEYDFTSKSYFNINHLIRTF